MLEVFDCRLEVEKVLLPMEEKGTGGGTVFMKFMSTAKEDSVVAFGSGGGGFLRKSNSAGWLEAVRGRGGGDGGDVKVKSACLVVVVEVLGTGSFPLQPPRYGMICGKGQGKVTQQ